MPIQPKHHHQDPERRWQAAEIIGAVPAQPRYRTPRAIGTGTQSWAGLNDSPVASVNRHRLNKR
ncbi:DNA repair protein [Micromonospora sp. WMMD1120]|uniref:DNA repair protein n=1 Tax=Micromonospora sp. WMMD1120 TaxID=3016106 RepID=UPI0024160E54|nr:DNA repair protein [Micromonospora sp. WMMD1120]MDG4808212.1 DNA repair protein [Micromonospora sp. WMMD1120]